MIMFNQRVFNIGVNNNMYANINNQIIIEHKRNKNILEGVLLIVDIKNILHHMRLLNGYHEHISFGMFSNLSIVRCYGLKVIQLRVLYNNLLHNSYIK